MSHLRVVPLTLKEANRLVGQWHRHHGLVVGHRWSIGVVAGSRLVGAVIVGRPVARRTPQKEVAEVSRCVTNGFENACSCLYAAAARAARAMGFREIQTFILASETGVSLRAAGWSEDPKPHKRGHWDRPARRRRALPVPAKRRWFKVLG